MTCIKPHFDIAPPYVADNTAQTKRNSYEIIPGRLTAVIVNSWFGTKLLVLNVYLDTNDGGGPINRAILMMMGIVIESNGLPYVIAGDMNMSPEELAKTGWVESVRGKIVCTQEPTCRPTPQHEGSVIDYFVISEWLTPLVQSVEVVRSDTYRPHCAVELTLGVGVKQIYEYRVSRPLSFPEERPILARGKPTLQWDDTPYFLELEDHAKWWMARMEDELIGIFGLEHEAGEADNYRGRANGFDLKRVTPDSGAKPSSETRVSIVASRLGFQIRDLAVAVDKARNTDNDAAVTNARARVEETLLILQKLSVDSLLINRVRQVIDNSTTLTAEQVGLINECSFECKEFADKITKQEADARASAYKRFLDKAIKHKNAQVLHAMVKPRPDTIARGTATAEGITTANQELAEAEMRTWEQHWQVGLHEDDEEVVLDDIDYSKWRNPTESEIQELRETIMSFKISTAVAYDNVRPKQMMHLSQQALAELLKLFWRCEALAR